MSKIGWTFVALGVLLIIGIDLQVASERVPSELEVEVGNSSASSRLQVYFNLGAGYNEAGSASAAIAAASTPQLLTFPLPDRAVSSLRLDPLMTDGSLTITALKIVTRSSPDQQTTLDLRQIKPIQEIARLSFSPTTGGLTITTTPGSTDSQCLLTLDQRVAGGQLAGWSLFLKLLSLDVSLAFIALLLLGILWFSTDLTLVDWWRSWHTLDPASRRRFHPWMVSGAVLLALYAWLLLLNLGRSPLLPEQEPSWVAVTTYAIAHRWQFGRDIILTYGPAMPLTICSYIGSIDSFVFVGRLLCKAWSLVLFVWLGNRLPRGRRWIFWLLAVALLGRFSEPACFALSMVAAGLLFARTSRADRWLLAPTLVYVTAIALVKVTFLLYAILLLIAVAADRLWRKQWLAALTPAVLFVVCFGLEWRLLGQELASIPLYLRGSFEMVSGFSQAMSEPPAPVLLILGLVTAALATLQLVLFFLREGRPRWSDLPMLALLGGALLLSWKQGFVRADYHVVDWIVYAMVSAAAVPAFFSAANRRLDAACFALIFLVGGASLLRLDPAAGGETMSFLAGRWRSDLLVILHPRQAAQAEKQSVLHNRLAYALPRVRGLVGEHTVDVFCDEQGIALLNNLNYKPRPSFLSYSTYTPWLMNLDVAFYCSPQAPDYVLFKLESIDNRLPTLQNGPLLLLLAAYYKPVLAENGYELFQRREQPRQSDAPAAFPLLAEGDIPLGGRLTLPAPGPLWCELEMRENLLGKLLETLYQMPAIGLDVTFAGGRVNSYRLLPRLDVSGFLLNPLPSSTGECLRWMAGQPLEAVTSIHLANAAQLGTVFAPRLHYKFFRVPSR